MSGFQRIGEPFFFWFSIFLCVFVLGVFGIHAILDTDNLPPLTPTFHFHGLTMVLWMILLPTQATLVRNRNLSLHMKLGRLSMGLAVLIIIGGILMSLEGFHRAEGMQITTINIFILINFSILYILGIRNRKKADRHKRLMIGATVAVLLPAIGRFTELLGIQGPIALLFWLAFLLVLPVYDVFSRKRIHSSTWLGMAMVIGGVVCASILMGLESWETLLHSILD